MPVLKVFFPEQMRDIVEKDKEFVPTMMKDIAEIFHKPVEYVQILIQYGSTSMGPSAEPCVFAELISIGSLSPETNTQCVELDFHV
jgi:hypothetical protein